MTLTLSTPLNRTRWETFALGCARGLSPRQAAEAAHYPRPVRQANWFLAKQEIVERINAIASRRELGGSSDVGGVIDRLISLSDDARKKDDTKAFEVARSALETAGRLKPLVPAEPALPRRPERAMSLAEWRAEFDPDWASRQTPAGA